MTRVVKFVLIPGSVNHAIRRDRTVPATALSVHVTNQGLAGCTQTAADGFIVTTDGTGAVTVNVG